MDKGRAGGYISNLSGELEYLSFRPAALPPTPPLEISLGMMEKLIAANSKLAALETLSSHIPNIDLFVSMYVRKEALLSSQIEGTQCTLEDILDPTNEKTNDKDVSDVVNYVKATHFALDRMKELPLCNRLIRETHAVLMEGVRGQEKSPGEFRYTQNWIGGQGSTIKTARYIPPNPEDMKDAMSELERYMNGKDSLDVLIQAALIHYQFETIHPFLDGNGRVGRLLITLFLMQRNVITSPCLYISYFLKMNRTEYYDRMSQVRRTGDYEQWVGFFLDAVYESTADAIQTIDLLEKLHADSNALIGRIPTRRQSAVLKVFAYIEENPIIDTQRTSMELGMSYNTTSKAIAALEDIGILKQSAKSGKARIYSYWRYLDILRQGT